MGKVQNFTSERERKTQFHGKRAAYQFSLYAFSLKLLTSKDYVAKEKVVSGNA